MKTLLSYKTTDLVVQAMTILFSVLYFAYDTKFDSVFVFYFLVGSNQVISCLANLFLDKRLRNSTRSYYQFLLLLLIAFFFLSVLNNVFGVILGFCLIYLSPVFALWYFTITVQEFINIKLFAKRKINIPNN